MKMIVNAARADATTSQSRGADEELSDRFPGRGFGRSVAPSRQYPRGVSRRGPAAVGDIYRQCHGLAGDGPPHRLLRIQGRSEPGFALVPDDGTAWRLYDILQLLARRRVAVGARRDRHGYPLRRRLGGAGALRPGARDLAHARPRFLVTALPRPSEP